MLASNLMISALNPFSNRRIGRLQFCLSSALVWLALALLNSAGLSGPVSGFVVATLATGSLIGLCVARLHDLGKSAWWLVLIILPIVGAVYLAWQLVFMGGQASANPWGPNRKAPQDFLTVR